jgi:hypothetical protein
VLLKLRGYIVSTRSTGRRGEWVGVAYRPGFHGLPDFVSGVHVGKFARRKALKSAEAFALTREVRHG